MNMNKMLQQAQKMQKEMEKEQNIIEETLFSNEINGAIKIDMLGNKRIQEIKINPEFIDVDDVEMLEDTIVSLVNKTLVEIETTTEEKMAKYTKGMGSGLPF